MNRRIGKYVAVAAGIVMVTVVAAVIVGLCIPGCGYPLHPPTGAGVDEQARHYWRKLKTHPSGNGIYGDAGPGEYEIGRLTLLGPNARAVVPEMLEEILQDTRWAPHLARAFAKIGPVTPEVIPKLCLSLDKTSGSTPYYVARSLGEMGPAAAPAADALVKALSYSDFQVRHEAAFALVKIGVRQREAVPVLMAEFRKGDPGWHKVAMLLARCGKEGSAALPELQRMLRAADKPLMKPYLMVVIAHIQEVPDGGVGQLISILQAADLESDELAGAVMVLGELGDTGRPAIPHLVALFRRAQAHAKPGDGFEIRCTIARALGNLRTKEPAALQVLREGAKDANSSVRDSCRMALESLRLTADPP